MKMLKLEVPHSLPLEDARKRLEALVDYWTRTYGVKADWAGPVVTLTGKAMGVSLTARIEVSAGKVGGEATDPGLLLRGQAQKYITRKLNLYLDPSKTLEAIDRIEKES